jgi:hypothetical protein
MTGHRSRSRPGFTDDGKLTTATVHDNVSLFVSILHHIEVDEFDLTGSTRPDIRLLDTSAGRTTDVEGPHGELCSRFSDGLGGEDIPNGLTHLDRTAVCQIPAVTPGTDAIFGTAGQNRADQDRGNAGVFNFLRIVFIDFVYPPRTITSSVNGSG